MMARAACGVRDTSAVAYSAPSSGTERHHLESRTVNDEAALRPGACRRAGHADPVELGQRSDQRHEGRAAESDAQIQQAAGPVRKP